MLTNRTPSLDKDKDKENTTVQKALQLVTCTDHQLHPGKHLGSYKRMTTVATYMHMR